MEQIQLFLSLLAQGLLVITLPIVIAAAVQHFRAMSQKIYSGIDEIRAQAIQQAIRVAVQAAEQSGVLDGLIGEEKRKRAIQIAQSFLKERGVSLDLDKIVSLIEAEVLQQFNNPNLPADTVEARQALIDRAVEAAVLAAEHSGLKGHIQNVGAEKKAYALNLARKYLAAHGMTLDDELLDGLMEAQLLRLALAARGISIGDPF